ncbi:Uncharacterized protein FKW44_000298, partial [Caligus rogercresseyi]
MKGLKLILSLCLAITPAMADNQYWWQDNPDVFSGGSNSGNGNNGGFAQGDIFNLFLFCKCIYNLNVSIYQALGVTLYLVHETTAMEVPLVILAALVTLEPLVLLE